jgi:hypothetical protein
MPVAAPDGWGVVQVPAYRPSWAEILDGDELDALPEPARLHRRAPAGRYAVLLLLAAVTTAALAVDCFGLLPTVARLLPR